MLPVAVMALFSFNDPPGKSNVTWHGFSLDAWLNPFGVPQLFDVVRTSILVALISTIVATTLGTLIALALVRYGFRGSGATNVLIFLPMATPEIVLGASLLTLFVAIGQPPFFPTNFLTILIAHIMFNISYVVVTVRARLYGFDRHLEEAAMDLGRERVDDVLEGHLPDDPARDHGRGPARLQPVDRRLRDHELHRRSDLDVPDLHLGLRPDRRAGPGQRDRHRVLPDRGRVRGDHDDPPVARPPAAATAGRQSRCSASPSREARP